MPKQTIYLAYGSNLNVSQMAKRCPTAEVLGATELRGYDLKFRGGDGRAVATVEPGEGVVPALLWKLEPSDEQALDHYEGWPSFYRKETVEIELDGKPVEAMVYIMNDGHELGQPSAGYLNAIREGYRTFGFDEAVLEAALERSQSQEIESQNLLYEKLKRNMSDIKKDWHGMSRVELIENTQDISLTQSIYDSMINTNHALEIVEYLMKFMNPLEVIRDQCLDFYDIDIDDALEDELEDLVCFTHTELTYALDPEYAPDEPQQEMEL